MTETSTLSLKPGDRVVYPKQGLCTVDDIRTEEVAGHRLVFVSLVFAETGARVKVPQDKLVKNGVRLVATEADVKEALAFLKSDSEKASLNWKLRKADNVTRMTEGGLVGLAQVVKELQVLSELRPLPPKEREQYNAARHLFVGEIAAAMGLLAADCEDALDLILFPVGKERPKRSIEEFQALAGEDDELGLDDLGDIDGGAAEEEEAPAEEAEAEEGEGEEKPKPAKGKGKKLSAAELKKSLLSDIELTEPMATALPTEPPKKKRGRPPKPKPEITEPVVPKKRGRPPKAKVEPAAPKKAAAKPKAKAPAGKKKK